MGYNYNLICNVKKKARPLVLNVKGVGYTIHHSVFFGEQKHKINGADASGKKGFPISFGDFFINEKKTKTLKICNEGEFNFDFVWKRSVNKYITITPDTGTVRKGENQVFEIVYLPIAEHKLKNYKATL
jgi:hydrocephalus-inducing protein